MVMQRHVRPFVGAIRARGAVRHPHGDEVAGAAVGILPAHTHPARHVLLDMVHGVPHRFAVRVKNRQIAGQLQRQAHRFAGIEVKIPPHPPAVDGAGGKGRAVRAEIVA